MKKIILLVSLCVSIVFVQAQTGSWKIKLNNKTLLNTNKEDEIKNIKKIKLSDWKRSGNLEIFFTEDDKDTWFRSFQLVDELGNELMREDSMTYMKLPLPALRKLFAGKKETKIYTTVSPVDPSIAIRMRRVHLCTLQLP